MGKILVGMSGGVDSSVAALLLQQAGFECVGGTMKLYVAEGKCGSLDDAADARAVAERLGMEHYVFDASQDFEKNVRILHFGHTDRKSFSVTNLLVTHSAFSFL